MRRTLALVFLFVAMVVPFTARASPPTKSLEDAYADGDVDPHDLLTRAIPRRATEPAPERRATWVTLAAFADVPAWSAQSGWGAMAIVGIAFDKLAQGPSRVTAVADGPTPRPTVPPPAPPPPPPPPPTAPARTSAEAASAALVLTAKLARSLVAAAWRAAGLSASDAKLDAIADRARKSGLLPETRLRALTTNDAYIEEPLDGSTHVYDSNTQRFTLEARLTWRLDRLLYADDEPTLARLRLDSMDARARVAGKALEGLFIWQRARLDEAAWADGSRERIEAALRRMEAEATLDVLTAGWFTSWLASQTGASGASTSASP